MQNYADDVAQLPDQLSPNPVPIGWSMGGLVGRVEGQKQHSQGWTVYESILPPAWSFMLAARLRGLGTAYTTHHLAYEHEIADPFGIPLDSISKAALLPVAYYTGEAFRPAERIPLEGILH